MMNSTDDARLPRELPTALSKLLSGTDHNNNLFSSGSSQTLSQFSPMLAKTLSISSSSKSIQIVKNTDSKLKNLNNSSSVVSRQLEATEGSCCNNFQILQNLFKDNSPEMNPQFVLSDVHNFSFRR